MSRTAPTARTLWILGSVTVALFVVLALIDVELQDTGGPGILPFELEFTSENARESLAEWGEDGRDLAKLSLWIDYLFLVAYAAFFSLAVTAVCEALGWRRWLFLATFPLIAAVCDAIENANLLLAIGQDGDQPFPFLAGVFAVIKLVTLTAAQLFAVAGLIVWLRRRGRRRS